MTSTVKTADVNGVPIEYRDIGSGPTLVFVHGVFVNGDLWADVVERLSDRYRCISPTLPLGGHRVPVPDGVDRSASSIAALIPGFIEALDLGDVTLVANDTGGGFCLIALGGGHAGLDRIGRLVLTNCDSYENFPPKAFKPFVPLVRRAPGPTGRLLSGALRLGPARKGFMRSVASRPLDDDRQRSFFDPIATDPAIRRDAVAVMQALDPSATAKTAWAIPAFDRPVLLAWGERCKFFPLPHAKRLAADFPNARLEPIPESRTFVPIDAPDRLAELIDGFVPD